MRAYLGRRLFWLLVWLAGEPLDCYQWPANSATWQLIVRPTDRRFMGGFPKEVCGKRHAPSGQAAFGRLKRHEQILCQQASRRRQARGGPGGGSRHA